MIETFYNTTAMNTRKTTSSPTGGDSLVTVSSSIAGVLRPIVDKSRLFIESNIGKEFDFVCDDSEDVRVGDNMYINAKKYDTLGVSSYEDLEDDSDSHLNVRLVGR